MTKKVGADPGNTRARLIESGKREFRTMGYSRSSLRRICADASVTTGALYFFFRDKDDMFRSILEEVTVPFMEMIESHYRSEDEEPDATEDEGVDSDQKATDAMIDFYFMKKDVFDILLSSLDHPFVKEFFDSFIKVSTEHYRKVLGNNVMLDGFALHMFLHMQLDMMLSLASHGFGREEMKKHARSATIMLRGAFRALVTQI